MAENEFPSAFVDFINSLDFDFDKRDVTSAPESAGEMTPNPCEWVVEDAEHDGKMKSAIRSGDVVIYYDRLHTPEPVARLSWRANRLPLHFSPGGDGVTFEKFREAFFYDLPKAMGYVSGDDREESIMKFLPNSTVAFDHSHTQRSREYDFIKPGELYNFAADYMRLPENFYPVSLRVFARKRSTFATQPMYNLRLQYHDIDTRAGEMTLQVPIKEDEIQLRLTPELMQFATETHERRDRLLGYGNVAEGLLSVIVDLAKRK
jgi:hypothetical protein